VRTKKFKEFLANYPSEAGDKSVSNYSANFRVGGCDWPGTWDASKWPPARDSIVKNPSKTVHMTDGGTIPIATDDPLKCVTEKSVEKPGCWIVHDPKNDDPCVGCCTSPADPNWGGPHLRHSGKSAVAFVDTHVESLVSAKWYWAGTPWLRPDLADR